MGTADKPPAEFTSAGEHEVEDDRHLIACEGELSGFDVALRLASTAAVAALTARAILIGDATAWHLLLPMVAQGLGIASSVLVAYLVVRRPEMRKAAVTVLLVATALCLAGRTLYLGQSPSVQIPRDLAAAWRWIADAHMHWPILLAFISEALAMPGRVRDLFVHGPPFSSVSLGCGMRIVVLFFAGFLLPFSASSPQGVAWLLWWVYLIAEVLALWMHLDLQHQLRKQDQQQAGQP
jgi:hypothetical protein